MSDIVSLTEIVQSGPNLVVTIIEPRMRDVAIIQQIRDEILGAINSQMSNNVVVDLKHVEYVGSVAFLAFLAIRRQPSVNRVVLCNLDFRVREVFTLCRLIPTENQTSAPFEVAETLAAAQTLLA